MGGDGDGAGTTSGGVYAGMSTEEVKRLVHQSLSGKCEGVGLPVFLHVPKSGGTAIETALGQIGISVGYCHKRPFEFREKFVGYEAWHTPPKGRVANSWAIVRDPCARAERIFMANQLVRAGDLRESATRVRSGELRQVSKTHRLVHRKCAKE